MVFERQIATAARLIDRYGQACYWREPGTPTGSPAAPQPGTPTDYPVKIVWLSNPNREALAGLLSMIAGTEVPTGGKRGLMAGNVPFTPSLRGRISPNAAAFSEPAFALHQENGIDLLNPNGNEPILYYLRVAI
jgi:hypothetical protein